MNMFDKHGIELFQSRNELGNRQDVGEISVVGNVGLCKSFRARARWSRLCILVSRLRSQERKDEKKTQKAQKIIFILLFLPFVYPYLTRFRWKGEITKVNFSSRIIENIYMCIYIINIKVKKTLENIIFVDIFDTDDASFGHGLGYRSFGNFGVESRKG